jgi:hypothetical protein
MGGIAATGGGFVRGDKTQHAKGEIIPSFQTATIEYDRMLNDLSSDKAKSYVNSKSEEYEAKALLMKSMLYAQTLGDGTGRFCEPAGIGPDSSATGATITCLATSEYSPCVQPLRMKISDLTSTPGSIAHLVEGFAFSIWYADYDMNNDGVYEGTSDTCIPRILTLGFKNGIGGAESFYDAFRIVDVDVEAGYIYVLPGRFSALNATTEGEHTTYTQIENNPTQENELRWCVGELTHNMVITPYQGLSAGLLNPVAAATIAGGFDSVFNPTGKQYAVALMHPYYMPDSHTNARKCLGLNWDATTDLGRLNPFIPCGIESLLMDTTHTIHGIRRATIRQALPTIKDCEMLTMNHTLFRSIVTKHATRNPVYKESNVAKKGEGGDIGKVGAHWQHIALNPVVYSTLLDSVEFNTMFSDGKGSYGEEGARVFSYGQKRYQIIPTNEMALRRIWIIPKGALEYFGGHIEDVSNDEGQKKFLKIGVNGQRTNVVQEHKIIKSAMRLRYPRSCGGAKNFTW